MKTLKKILIIAVVFAMILILPKLVKAATPFTLTGKNIYLKQSSYVVYEGGTGSITDWSSSDPTVASVDDTGKITGLKIGQTTISAKRGEETASCVVNIVYYSLRIGANQLESQSDMDLVLGIHPTENLRIKIEDYDSNVIENAQIQFVSSDTSVATVDTQGKVTAAKVGETTITASAAGVSDTILVKVNENKEPTDFSNAKFEIIYDGTGKDQTLKVTNVTPKDTYDYAYGYIITPNKTKPELKFTEHGELDSSEMGDSLEHFSVNADENYLFSSFEKYTELNQDLYIWVVEEIHIPGYYNEEGSYTSYSVRFAVEGKKLERPALPPLNLIIKSSHIGEWKSSDNTAEDAYTFINFYFPTDTEQRKFTLKIGKVTDNSILNKIKNEDYSGIQDLLQYAKTHEAIYTENLTTTYEGYFRSDKALFDGKKLLTDDAYYYMYVQFDDENGKYFPVEGVTLGQAYISSASEHWFLTAYTESDFNWDGLTSTYTPSDNKPTSAQTKPDPTVAPTSIPQTGQNVIVVIAIASVVGLGVYTYRRLKNYRDVI